MIFWNLGIRVSWLWGHFSAIVGTDFLLKRENICKIILAVISEALLKAS